MLSSLPLFLGYVPIAVGVTSKTSIYQTWNMLPLLGFLRSFDLETKNIMR